MPKKRLVQSVVMVINILIAFFLCKPEYYLRRYRDDSKQKNDIVIVFTPVLSEPVQLVSLATSGK